MASTPLALESQGRRDRIKACLARTPIYPGKEMARWLQHNVRSSVMRKYTHTHGDLK